jgi:precorrin-2 dehydrogenase/sirohydrochlorin ferrochelatase
LKLKDTLKNQKDRRKYLYEIFEDEKINDLIEHREIDEAKNYIDNLIRGLN